MPHRYAAAAEIPAARGRYQPLEAVFAGAEAAFHERLDAIDRYGAALTAIGDRPPPAPRWNQDWFPGLDAAVAYTMVRDIRPACLIEVGSGHSTRFFARAAADAGQPMRLIAIDPHPRADIAGIAETVIRQPLQAVSRALFAALAAGDILSIDSSHLLMPGSDVDVLVNRVLPEVADGVLVHFHDIFLPDDYPPDWAWRGYNEQLAVAPLLWSGGWRLVWSSRWVRAALGERVARSVVARLPMPAGAIESSLWLVRARAPARAGS